MIKQNGAITFMTVFLIIMLPVITFSWEPPRSSLKELLMKNDYYFIGRIVQIIEKERTNSHIIAEAIVKIIEKNGNNFEDNPDESLKMYYYVERMDENTIPIDFSVTSDYLFFVKMPNTEKHLFFDSMLWDDPPSSIENHSGIDFAFKVNNYNYHNLINGNYDAKDRICLVNIYDSTNKECFEWNNLRELIFGLNDTK